MSEELAIIEEGGGPANLFGVGDPAAVVRRSTDTANALTDVIRQKRLYANIQGRSHVLVDGWTLLGSMLGVFPVVVWTRKLSEPDGWEARVEARTLAGAVVGAAEAQCTREENAWGYAPKGKGGKPLPPRDDYALRSMAQTRATAKALRGPLGFIVHLAGFAATPAEEMPTVVYAKPAGRKASQAQHAKLNAMCADLDANEQTRRPDGQTWEDHSRQLAAAMFEVESRAELTSAQMQQLIDRVEAEAIPF